MAKKDSPTAGNKKGGGRGRVKQKGDRLKSTRKKANKKNDRYRKPIKQAPF